ncbi:hypothetical protein [Desertivirga xinjiangensis]|uniref:hypothetical protein n=1 Tax=Desertivirga xinjiangensis TaxID=539206 RepID=UPI00210C7400|nr:hypothetical protein [Pedobacter xinjiangensis]
MTFEEFFAKKKIDLGQLEKAEPGLFSEFKSHFHLMGEKSFDHSKKFWFNKLRRLYHLAAQEKEAKPVQTAIAAQAEPLSSPTMEQVPSAPSEIKETSAASPIGKPAFKPRNIPVKNTEEVKPDMPAEETVPVKKPGFRPRNLPSADAQSVDSRPGQSEVSEKPSAEAASTSEVKQPYRPKFNVRNLPKNPSGVEEQTGSSTEETASPEPENKSPEIPGEPKPAYKPRFNPKNVPVQKPAEEETDAAENAAEEPSPEAPKPAYKPRFNAKNIPAHKPAEDAPAAAENAAEDPSPEAPKPAYKPRFNAKNIKPKPEE